MASEPTSPTTPSSPNDDSEATKEWLETILEGYHTSLQPNQEPDVELGEWSVKPATDEREGYLSEQLALGVTYTASGHPYHAHLLAKLLPQDPFNRAFVIESLFDLREIKFYQEIKPAVEAVERKYLTEEDLDASWTPDLYFAKHKEATESILVLDDMCQHGYKVPELTDGMSLSQTRSALVTLANFHAATVALQLKEAKTLPEVFPYLLSVDQAVESFNCLVERGLPLLLKFLESRKDQVEVREGLSRYSGPRAAQVLREVLAPSDKLNTLVHCDFWCNNLLFKEEEDAATQCCIIDWQMVMYSRPAIDVALLITTSLEPADRRKHGSELLTAYWDSFLARLSKFGIESKALKYTKQDLEGDYRAAQAMAALVVVGSVDIALGTPGREERVLNLLADLLGQGVL